MTYIYLFFESRLNATLDGILLPTFKRRKNEYHIKYINILFIIRLIYILPLIPFQDADVKSLRVEKKGT